MHSPTSSPSKFYLYKRTNGYYYIGYCDADSVRWKSTHSKLKTDALKALRHFEQLLSEKTKAITFQLFKRDILQFVSTNYAKRTYIIYELAVQIRGQS